MKLKIKSDTKKIIILSNKNLHQNRRVDVSASRNCLDCDAINVVIVFSSSSSFVHFAMCKAWSISRNGLDALPPNQFERR